MMEIYSIILLAIGVAMDAFAISIAKGLSVKQIKLRHYASVALWFGGFQALMPLIGYFIGFWVAPKIEGCDHWIAFVLLGIIGGKMIKEALSNENEEATNDFSYKTMFVIAIATSIDALAVGVSFAFVDINIWIAVTFIGVITGLISAVGIKIGHCFGARYRKGATMFGGMVIIVMAVNILIEHLLA